LTGAATSCALNPAAPPSAQSEYRIIDLMPRYWGFRAGTVAAPPGERARRFRADVIGAEPRFFEQVIGPVDDAGLSQYLAAVEPLDSIVRRIGAEFLAAVPTSWNRLRALFPDLAPGVRIFVTPSLFISNGQVRYLDDSLVVMLGPDVQAYVEVVVDSGRRTDPAIGIEHELTHYHHWRANAEIARAARSFFRAGSYSALYYNLWSEGMATWVARRLHPDAPLAEVLGPGLNPARDEGLVPELAREFARKLDSTVEDDIRDLFYLSGRRKDIPARSAYYLGYLVVDRLARDYSLPELIQLHGPELRQHILDALTSLTLR
jgi:hypothetical protein